MSWLAASSAVSRVDRHRNDFGMKYTIYEDPITHKFALLRLPDRFVDGDKLSILSTERWFDSREEAVAALPGLLNLEE
jgi:hypothetical protein